MPHIDISKPNFSNPNLDPARKPTQFHGLGAFVLLDYSLSNAARFEHSVIFLPNTWEAMYELIRAPGAFMEEVRGRAFTEVKDATSAVVTDWPFASPITIHIEPLTVASPKSLATLAGLSTLYPGFGAVVAGALKMSPNAFRSAVIAAANGPLATEAQLQHSAQRRLSPWIAPTTKDSHSHDQKAPAQSAKTSSPGSLPIADSVAVEWQEAGSDIRSESWELATPSGDVPLPVPTHPLYFVAEFALMTRVLTIKYIPQTQIYPPVANNANLRFQRGITPVTINPVQHMAFDFLHFDMDFSADGQSHENVATARAALAMDFIENPLSLGPTLGNVSAPPNSRYHYVQDTLTPTDNPIHQKSTTGSAIQPTVTWPNGLDPVVILDSVLPSPSELPVASPGTKNTTYTVQSDPVAPSPCVIVYYVNGVPYYIVIKNYN